MAKVLRSFGTNRLEEIIGNKAYRIYLTRYAKKISFLTPWKRYIEE